MRWQNTLLGIQRAFPSLLGECDLMPLQCGKEATDFDAAFLAKAADAQPALRLLMQNG